jgi:hypothetical protein
MSGTVSRPNRQVCDILRSLSLGPFDYLKWKLLAVRCEAATPVNVTVSVASVLRAPLPANLASGRTSKGSMSK